LCKSRPAWCSIVFQATQVELAEWLKVKTFSLVKDRSLCCFAKTPRMNDKVYVRMREGRFARYINDQAITVFGMFKVGEAFDKNGQVTSIYRLEGDDVSIAPKLRGVQDRVCTFSPVGRRPT